MRSKANVRRNYLRKICDASGMAVNFPCQVTGNSGMLFINNAEQLSWESKEFFQNKIDLMEGEPALFKKDFSNQFMLLVA